MVLSLLRFQNLYERKIKMKRCVRHALIFTGGVTTGLAVGAVGVAALMVKHKEYVKHCIADVVERWIFEDCYCVKEVCKDVE
jgi:hypothetical protein